MRIKRDKLEELISAGDLREIFINHLGWDKYKWRMGDVVINFAEEEYKFSVDGIAEKRGFVVCRVRREEMPKRSVRQKLETYLLKAHYEHLLVLEDGEGMQKWIYTVNKSDKPVRFVEISARPASLLVDKLLEFVFDINEEDELTITEVSERANAAFTQNTERVTRQFYGRFRKELDCFSKFIEGIQKLVDREHYGSLMLNRLMFVYFIQKKEFLNGDKKYLQNRLKMVQEKYGKDEFYGKFYRYFLKTLFHQGLGTPQKERDPKINELIGEVPYLNGGLFDEHRIELGNDDIKIPDEAFEGIFKFFDEFQWILNDRINAREGEINPDVIGYIFEKYINDRAAMGAYYTKEDITGYIAKNTILPALLQKARNKCKEAFDSQSGTIWKLLRDNPDDYFYESARKGCDITDDDLPKNIRRGLDSAASDLSCRRADWNEEAEEKFALSGETWRETIARRRRYFALKEKIESGGITDIADLTTHNLNIEKLTADAITKHEGTDFLSAFYFAIAGRKKVEKKNINERRGLTVLDPACGSGAFLFAALNMLQPLYKKCIARMNVFVDEDDILSEKLLRRQKKHEEYRIILKEIEQHPNEDYWICRNIILHNLFGVDIMPDAAEVAKLRLFLKLAAESVADKTKPNMGLEPLPDIDFNVRTGNSLVGFSDMAEFEKAAESAKGEKKSLDYGGLSKDIRDKAERVGMAYKRFIDAQDSPDGEDFRIAKKELKELSEKMKEELNEYLARNYGIIRDIKSKEMPKLKFSEWKKTHRPFHWFTEFYDIMENGGFDVVIGNPPYVEKRKVPYELINFFDAEGNLYAFLIEKSVQVLQAGGVLGMIVPISLPSTNRMGKLRNMLRERFSFLYAANFADRPGTLFSGVHQKLTVVMGHAGRKGGFYTTNYLHWSNKNERDDLFNGLHYRRNEEIMDRWGKFGDATESAIWQKLQESEKRRIFYKKPTDNREVFYINKRLMFWLKSCVIPKASDEYWPYVALNGVPCEAVVAMLNSSVYFWFWEVVGDGWHLTEYELGEFNFGVKKEDIKCLADLGKNLEEDLEKKKRYVNTRQTEYEYVHARSKHIIDEIDKILAQHYGFTEEELDYIINYNYKYRMSGADTAMSSAE